MFENIGEKIKMIAKIYFYVCAIASFILGCVMIDETPLGLVVMVVGVLVSYLSSLVMYAFGELVENSTATRREIKEISKRTFEQKLLLKEDILPEIVEVKKSFETNKKEEN